MPNEIKKTGRGGKYNFPNAIDPDTQNGESIAKTLKQVVRWYKAGQDRPATTEGIQARIAEYFQTCINEGERPTVESMCLATGYARQTINDWRHGLKCDAERAVIIKQAFDTLAAFDAGQAVSGEQPIPVWIFRAKNYYDMRDEQQIVVQPKAPLEAESAESIAEKYAELPD